MTLAHCSDEDRVIIARALRAASDGPFFEDWEFSTLFGLERSEVSEIARRWPDPSLDPATVDLAVANSLGNLLGYPHGEELELQRWVSVPRRVLDEVFERWKARSRTEPNA